MSNSKMQELIDRAEAGLKVGGSVGHGESIGALIEAVKLLSRAQQQTMGDIDKIGRRSRDGEIPIGGGA